MAQNEELRDDIDTLATQMQKMEQRLDGKIDKLGSKVDKLETKVDKLETKVDTLETKVDTLETKVEAIPDQVVAKLDAKLEAYVENRKTDLLGVSSDEIKLMQDKVTTHEERISVLESR